MPYTTETYQKAINILQHRRDNATLDLQQRTAEAQSKIPELADIQKRLWSEPPKPLDSWNYLQL